MLTLIVLIAHVAAAQSPPATPGNPTVANPTVEWTGELGDALRTHEKHAVKMTGWRFTYQLKVDGKIVDSGFFGVGLEKVLGESPVVLAEIHKFRAMKFTSAISFGLAFTSIVLGVIGPSVFPPEVTPRLSYGMLATVALFTSIGVSNLIFAPMFLSRAVSFKNDQIIGAAIQGAF